MYSIEDLTYLMSRLRDPVTGCPWDLKQTYKTIVSHTLEEAYEVADTINRNDKFDLKDELGDLLFQVIFYYQLGKEDKAFQFEDVVDNVVRKLIRRHPHVFPDGDLHASFPEGTSFGDEDVKRQWEQIKAEERALKQAQQEAQVSENDAPFVADRDSLLADVPTNLPALNRAEKLQKRASQHGFDWENIEDVLLKVEEELAEIRAELKIAKDKDLRDPDVNARMKDELGDLLFCSVNLARFLKVNADESLRSTNDKFLRRFQYIESALAARGSRVDDESLEELDRLWVEAKSV
jgi:ATP diphosphatase